MRKLNRRAAVATLGAGALAACAAPMRVAEPEKKTPKGGIGGTGIVGTLTDFGSLIVNGLIVETDGATKVTTAFGPADAATLAIGQNLTIEAATETASLFARRVHVAHPVIGVVQRLSADGMSALISGIDVTAEPGAIGSFAEGATVAVSGAWRGSRVLASRIDRFDPLPQSAIAGVLTEGTGPDTRAIAGVPLAGIDPPDMPPTGTFVTVVGKPVNSGFMVQTLTSGRFTGAAGALTDLSVEGYLEPEATAPFYTVSGLGHSFDPAAKLAPFETTRTLFVGRYVGTFAVEYGVVLPDDLANRRSVMRTLQAGDLDAVKLPAR